MLPLRWAGCCGPLLLLLRGADPSALLSRFFEPASLRQHLSAPRTRSHTYMSFRWALAPDGDACGHDPALCNCAASGTAAQSLDEVAFARSACQAAAAGAAERLARILERAPDAVHSDGGNGAGGRAGGGVKGAEE